MDVPETQERWEMVGEQIADRIDELNLLQVEVQRMAGISDKTLTGYMNGKPIKRPDKRRGLCRALGWTDDSIARMLRGEKPMLREDQPRYDVGDDHPTDYNSRIARMPEHVRKTIDDLIDGFERRRGED